MKLNTTNKQVIDEYEWGMWVWQADDGTWLGDGDGNVMYVFSTFDNMESVRALSKAARYYYGDGGKPVFLSGRHPIDDEEYEHQVFRHKMGLTPDQLDLGALNDEIEAKRNESK